MNHENVNKLLGGGMTLVGIICLGLAFAYDHHKMSAEARIPHLATYLTVSGVSLSVVGASLLTNP